MEFRVLGPLEVIENDHPLSLGGVRQRSVLAALLLRANELVSTDELIDEIWGESPPPRATKTIQVYVSRLRKILGDDRLVTRPPGYVLRVAPEEMDLSHFEQLAAEARGTGPERAAEKLREALDLWRGPPLADLAYEAFAQLEIARLEELRLAALEDRVDADLMAGRHSPLVGELEALVARHPLREHMRAQLMLALYRSGRQAEALAAYRDARGELAEGLGLEPGEELRRLEEAILRHEPELELPDPVSAGAAPVAPSVPERSVLVVPRAVTGAEALLGIAEPLAAAHPPRELIVACVVPAPELSEATSGLGMLRERLIGAGLAVRTAAFSSPSLGEDVARLASLESVDLLLLEGGPAPIDGDVGEILARAPCDVGVLVQGGGTLREGPLVVPFGASTHDWAALELGAWLARSTGAIFRIAGAGTVAEAGERDASRLLADASLIVQRTAGVVAEPVLAAPGRAGLAAAAEGAGLLVVGLSERWRDEGLGRARQALAEAPAAPTVLVRRGTRPGGVAPPETRTRFRWSVTGAPL
jgi:DNA-binding SARP family transcriptional activator